MPSTPFDFFVQWHLTERCNLHCRHCYQQAAVNEMDYGEVCRAIDNVKSAIDSWVTDYGMEISPSFHFTGGEPLLNDDFFPLLDYTRNCGFSTALMSNGTLITGDIARRLRGAEVSDVQVSVEGLEAVHDSIRGHGSYRRALHGIENLISQGVDVNINLTLSRLNMGQIDGLVRLAEEMGISAVTVSRLVICGRGKELADEMLSPQELADFYRNLVEIKASSRVMVDSRDPLFTVAVMDDESLEADFPIGGCAAGVFGITIAADGSIMPCRRMDLSIGNIRELSFRELWAESPVLWSLRNRHDYHGSCGSCCYWAVCRGCRAVALASARSVGSEDYLGPDPQCAYYRKAK
jgi:radical SAM protein with 4Fe4S-binding SPASM domain